MLKSLYLRYKQLIAVSYKVRVLARVSMLARLNAFLENVRKVVNLFEKKFSLLSLNIRDDKLLRICL